MHQNTTPVFDVGSLVTQLGSAVSASDVLTLIGVIVGAGIGFVLIWFGARKLIRTVMSSMKSGKINL